MPRQGDQIGWRLFSNVGERVVAWTKAGENDWILNDLLICNTFSAFLFTVLSISALEVGFSMGKKNVDVQEPGQV